MTSDQLNILNRGSPYDRYIRYNMLNPSSDYNTSKLEKDVEIAVDEDDGDPCNNEEYCRLVADDVVMGLLMEQILMDASKVCTRDLSLMQCYTLSISVAATAEKELERRRRLSRRL